MGEARVDEEERTFDLRPHRGALALALGQPAVKRHTPPPAGTHRHPPLDLRAGQFGTLLDASVAGVSPGLALVAAEQPMRLRVRWRRWFVIKDGTVMTLPSTAVRVYSRRPCTASCVSTVATSAAPS